MGLVSDKSREFFNSVWQLVLFFCIQHICGCGDCGVIQRVTKLVIREKETPKFTGCGPVFIEVIVYHF